MAAKIGKAPGDGHAQSRGRRRIAAFEVDECFLQLLLRSPEIACHHLRRDDGVMERRHDDGDPVVTHHGEAVEEMLLVVQPTVTPRARRRG